MKWKSALAGLSTAIGLGIWCVTALQPEKPLIENSGEITTINQEFSGPEEIPEITPIPEQNLDAREAIKAEAERTFKKMNDYTFRLYSPCNMGTGWILDYAIPENGGYPTTWYIATNLHVIIQYGFSSNPYDQKLPIPKEAINFQRNKYRDRGLDFSNLSLFYDRCNELKWYGYFDFNLAQEETGEKLKSDMGLVANKKIEEPKLFYAAVDFLKEDPNNDVQKNHWKDFAVIEVKFNNEEIAKKVTNEFAIKYPVNTTEAINLFADALEDRYSVEQIANTTENFYSFAYPATGDKFKASKTWNEDTLEADKISNDRWNWYHDKGEEKIAGMVAGKKISRTQAWGGTEHIRMGHMYLVKNFPLGKGSSGAMYVDGNNNLLGLKAVVETGKNAMNSWIEPIRSKGFKRGTINTPKYDLLLGGDNQLSSYRQQIERFNKKTFLSERKWKHITKLVN